ncbi:MAG: hypothetical protein KJ729_07405 [Euryarchaeota archaeon]|nr:hypothetical protein [Euryarchaeota archaeon]
MKGTGKKLILSIVILTIIVVTSWILLNTERQTPEEIQAPEPWVIPPPTTEEPVPRALSTQGYVYDDKLGYGFKFPDGWEFSVSVDKDVEQCDPTQHYEAYNCADFPDANIKKVVSFEKLFKKKFEGSEYESEVSVRIELIVKSATDLQEVKNEFKQRLLGMSILNETTISVNKINGYDILIGEDSGWKLRQRVFFANGTAYIFTYQSQDEFYRMYEDIFNNTINSFNINPDSQTPASIASQSSKEIMRLADGTWNVGDGYTLTANAIDTNVRHVWLSLSKNGVQLDEKILNEGETYTYNNSIKIKIAKIYVGANSQDMVTLTDESVASHTPFP